MTVTASGTITMSDIMNEFNPSGGQSNIRLGDYIARKPDDFGGTITMDILVTWDGTRFLFDGVGPSSLTSFFMAQGKETIQFRLNSSVNVPFYVATTQNTTGSDLASGVTNNGAVHSASGGAYSNGTFTFVTVDLATAAGGTSELILGPNFANNKVIHINTNTQQTASGNNVGSRFVSLPDTNRFVTRNLPYLDITLNSGWSGGNEATYTQTTPTSTNYGTIIKNGTSIVLRRTMDVFPIGGQNGGFAPRLYSGNLYPVTYFGTGLGQGFNIGSGGYLECYPYTGSGNNYISGGPTSAGGRPNTGQGWADYFRIGVQNWTGGTLSTSGWGYSATNSGANLAVTITNNTGQDYAMFDYNNSTMGQRLPFNTFGIDASGNTIFVNTINYGSNSAYDIQNQNARYNISWNQNRYDGANLGTTTFALYDEASTNRAAAVANIAEVINDLGFGGSSTFPGVDIGSGNGTAYYYLDAYPNYPSTGTVRIRRVSSSTFYGAVGGQFLANAAGNPDVQSFFRGYFTGPSTGRGCSNITGSNSYSTGVTTLNEGNGAVAIGKFNVEMSDYYGTRNLGSDGG